MKKRQFISSALAGALCLTALCGCQGGDKSETRTAVAEVGTVESIVSDTGTVAYRDPYAVIPTVNGKILTCAIEEGDVVTAGQTLYTIDSTALEDQITQAALSLESARLALSQASAACGDLTVTAPAAGSVTAVCLHVGDYVNVGTPIAEVVDSTNLTLTVPFAPSDAAAMAAGSPAELTFTGFSGTVAGQVKRVYASSTPLSGGREGVYVEIAFTNPGAIAAGTTATAAVGGADCMAQGAVACGTQQTIYSTQAGQVLTLPIEVGDTVAVGQTVMTIENASLTNARDNAALAVETAAVSLAQLEAKRSDYVITAPVDGTVTTRAFKTGDYAAAATPLATLAGAAALQVQVPIDEIYIDQVWPGQQAQVTFTADSGEERSYGAAVRRVNDTGVTAGGVTDYTVDLELEATEGLRSGMNVTVSITTACKENCLRVPASAVSGGKVQVVRSGKAEEAAVTTGASGGGYVEITFGLAEGDTVVLP